MPSTIQAQNLVREAETKHQSNNRIIITQSQVTKFLQVKDILSNFVNDFKRNKVIRFI
jgi:hypothetical protein